MVYEINQKWLETMKEGWYYVDQSVYEVDSSGRNCAYRCDGEVRLISDLIQEKEAELLMLRSIYNS